MYNQNDLLVNLQSFSEIACLDGRLFGVKTTCDTCQLELNSCLRGQMLEALIAANRRAEADLGYALTPRYHVGEIELTGSGDHSKFRLKTEQPGVAAVNVKLQISSRLQNIAVSPYLDTVEVENGGEGYCVVRVSTSLVENPASVTLRDNSHRVYLQHIGDGYPRRVSNEWVIALGNQATLPCETVETLNVQHCKYVYVDIPASTTCLDCDGDVDTDAQILPVYPGTTEFIPLAKPIETVGTDLRYWFYVWTLVDPGFENEEIDLAHAEFWKLRSAVDFVCVREVPAGPDVIGGTCDEIIADPCADPAVEAAYDIEILDAQRGILDFSSNANLSRCSCEAERTIIRYYYKTDPAVLGYEYDLPGIATAIAYLAAANLPPNYCGCEIKVGFIHEAQKSQADARVNPVTGETIFVVKFGHTFGHYMYAGRIASAPKFNNMRYI